MRHIKKIIISGWFLSAAYLLTPFYGASAILLDSEARDRIVGRADRLGVAAGFATDQNPGSVVALIITGFLSLLGIIFIVLIIMAGYNWMTSAGEEQKITKAKETIKRAVIGLIIIVAAYSISYFVFSALGDVASGTMPE